MPFRRVRHSTIASQLALPAIVAARGRVRRRTAVEAMVRRQDACGLGMSIVREVVARHGGRFDVETTPATGSCFTVLLPLQQDLGSSPAA